MQAVAGPRIACRVARLKIAMGRGRCHGGTPGRRFSSQKLATLSQPLTVPCGARPTPRTTCATVLAACRCLWWWRICWSVLVVRATQCAARGHPSQGVHGPRRPLRVFTCGAPSGSRVMILAVAPATAGRGHSRLTWPHSVHQRCFSGRP
jgi:hypothetical protein